MKLKQRIYLQAKWNFRLLFIGLWYTHQWKSSASNICLFCLLNTEQVSMFLSTNSLQEWFYSNENPSLQEFQLSRQEEPYLVLFSFGFALIHFFSIYSFSLHLKQPLCPFTSILSSGLRPGRKIAQPQQRAAVLCILTWEDIPFNLARLMSIP